MRHGTIDQHARISNFHSFDPRAKIIASFGFIIIIALLKDVQTLLISLLFIISINIISGVPKKHLLKRYLIALPLIFFSVLSLYFSSGLHSSLAMLIRISTCVLCLIFLSSTTPFFDLLKGFRRLKIPNIFTILLLFTYRYFFVLTEELHRMKLARKARGFRGGKHLFDKRGMRMIANTAGMVLVRAYERSIRIYDALSMRGYDGTVKTLRVLHLSPLDIVFSFFFISTALILLLSERTVLI